jgi:hypothetical protein
MLSFRPAVNLQIVNLLTLPRATPRRRLRLYSKDRATFMLAVVIVVSVLVALGDNRDFVPLRRNEYAALGPNHT